MGSRAMALPLALDEPSQVPGVIASAAEKLGGLDILVANATATAFRPILEQKPHNVWKTFAISVESFVASVQAAAPLMKDGGLGVPWQDAGAATPVRRLGSVDDVASLVAYLVSDAAAFLTGQTILLDGGLTIVSPLQRLVEGS